MKEFKRQAYQKLVEQSGGVSVESLFVLLGRVQDTFGCVPREVVRDLAARTGFSEALIYGALTCYKDFDVRPER